MSNSISTFCKRKFVADENTTVTKRPSGVRPPPTATGFLEKASGKAYSEHS
jgi:hypothetical protein